MVMSSQERRWSRWTIWQPSRIDCFKLPETGSAQQELTYTYMLTKNGQQMSSYCAVWYVLFQENMRKSHPHERLCWFFPQGKTVLSMQSLQDEIADHPTVIGMHTSAVAAWFPFYAILSCKGRCKLGSLKTNTTARGQGRTSMNTTALVLDFPLPKLPGP